jgi:TetR/AcrR family tetracycline transcriptional repressor
MSTAILGYMNRDSKLSHKELLEHKRQLINDRLDAQRARINARFDDKQAQLEGKLSSRQEQIISAALELLEVEGLNSLSLRDIAKKLNVKASALYWHFSNKESLIDSMAELILQKGLKDLQLRQDDESWQDWLTNHMMQLRKAMLAYPDGSRVVAGAHLPKAPTLAQSLEYSIASLVSAGIDRVTSAHVAVTSNRYTLGFVIEEQASPTIDEMRKLPNNYFATFTEQYPSISKALEELQSNEENEDSNFIIGLQYIMRGSNNV